MRIKQALAITAGFAAIAPAVAAEEAGTARGVYVGAFGGGGAGSDSDITQRGTIFFIEAVGGPLATNARGQADGESVGFIGGQVGYELSNDGAVLPAFELEGLYLDTGDRSATLQNPNDRTVEQTFDTSFSTNSFVFLANLVFSFRESFHGVTPYVGGGIGGARVGAEDASSIQTNPTEGTLNHFNSDPDTSAWTFAAQAKAGVRIPLGASAYAFGEYRYLHIGATDLEFGSTVDAGHAPTSPWTVGLDGASLHLASVGIGLNF